jgi:hypothetical protein
VTLFAQLQARIAIAAVVNLSPHPSESHERAILAETFCPARLSLTPV